MRTRIVTVLLALSVSTAFACRQGAPAGKQRDTTTAGRGSVRLVGCLDAAAGSTLVLRTPNDAGPTTSFTGDNIYRLVPAGGVDLSADVGHEIEVTGQAGQERRASDRAVATSGSHGASGGRNSAQNAGVSGSNPGGSGVQGGTLGTLLPFHVKSFRKIADSCAGPGGD